MDLSSGGLSCVCATPIIEAGEDKLHASLISRRPAAAIIQGPAEHAARAAVFAAWSLARAELR